MLYISRFTPIPESSQLPMVCLDRLHHQPEGLASVTSNNRMGGRLAARALLDAGCVRPAILCSHEDLELLLTVNDRFQGFRQELAENHISLDKRDIIFSSLSIPESRQTIRRLVKRSRNFDGLFATSDISAIGAMAGLADNGVRVPEEVKVIGFDDISYCRYVNPSLSTIRQDTTRLGAEAARMLLEMLEGRGEGMGNLEIPVELVRRDSTAVLGCRRYKTPGGSRLGLD
jgi:LacI family transcriptional regulator